jgi:hypothetical protein
VIVSRMPCQCESAGEADREDRHGPAGLLRLLDLADRLRHAGAAAHFLRAAFLPPLAPAFFFCAVVPPCLGLEPDPDFFPPRLEAPGLLAMRAARDFDMPFSFSFSYCFSFLTLADLDGI